MKCFIFLLLKILHLRQKFTILGSTFVSLGNMKMAFIYFSVFCLYTNAGKKNAIRPLCQ